MFFYGAKLQNQKVQYGNKCYQIFFFIQYSKKHNMFIFATQIKNSDEIQKNSSKT